MAVAFQQSGAATKLAVPCRKRSNVCLTSTGAGGGKGTARVKKEKLRPKLFVLELEDLVPGKLEDNEKAIAEFVERLEVHTKASPTEPTRLIYSTGEAYFEALNRLGWKPDSPPEASDKSPDVFSVPLPDVLLTMNGLEVYQKGYMTPDPYWSSKVMSGWDPAPARWVISKFFDETLRPVTAEEDTSQLKFARKMDESGGIGSGVVLVASVEAKMAEMGLECRIRNDEENAEIRIVPAGGSVTDAVAYCQKMLQVSTGDSLVFGSSEPFSELMRTNLGVCPNTRSDEVKDEDSEESGRVFFSSKSGAAALEDGIVHHAFI